MRSLTLPLLLLIALILPSCALKEKAGATLDDLAVVASRARAATDAAAKVPAQIAEAKAAMDAKLDAAKVDLAAKGAPVDGSPAELTKWAGQNPGTALSSLGGFLMVLAASVARYRTAKKAATAAVDAVESLPPEAAAQFKTAAAASPHMTPSVASFIAAIKNR